jgi:hypothetical protein
MYNDANQAGGLAKCDTPMLAARIRLLVDAGRSEAGIDPVAAERRTGCDSEMRGCTTSWRTCKRKTLLYSSRCKSNFADERLGSGFSQDLDG